MKLYIVGPVASGKSTMARQVSQLTGIPCFHLDQVVYQKDPEKPSGNYKRPVEERNRLFHAILARDSYVLEDTGRVCFLEGMQHADRIILLDTSGILRRKRIVTRWIRQNFKLEPCDYRPNFTMLRDMFRWSRAYETGEDGTRRRALQFSEKLTVLHSPREIKNFLSSIAHEQA